MEIRKKKDETSARRKQILQLKAESEDIASTYHETFDFTEDEDDVMSGMFLVKLFLDLRPRFLCLQLNCQLKLT